MVKNTTLFLALVVLAISCITPDNPYPKLAPGVWRATLEVDSRNVDRTTREPTLESIGSMRMESVTEGLLPFNFEVKYEDEENFYIEIINGPERIKVTDIGYGRDKSTAYDTIRIDFPLYDTYIQASINGGVMEGNWHVPYRKNADGSPYSIPFEAHYGNNERFTVLPDSSAQEVEGTWSVSFLDDPPYPAIGEFKNYGQEITGTFRTETGDYRYLAGSQQGEKVFLSCFDGSHAFLFEAKLTSSDSLIGIFRSGKHYKTGWTAYRNSEARLQSPDSLTTVTSGESFLLNKKDILGKSINFNDEDFNNKIKLVKIMGTWCPNCRDQSDFLKKWITENNSDDLEIVSVGFERYRDADKSLNVLKNYKAKQEIPWRIVHGGYASKKEASAVFPEISRVISYPTLIFIDKKNTIRRIHTGFNGPATSKYKDFVRSFNETIAALRAE